MTRCRLSELGKRKGFNPRAQDRLGEYLGLYQSYIAGGPDRGKYRTEPDVVCVRWDGTKSIVRYHHTFIEVITED